MKSLTHNETCHKATLGGLGNTYATIRETWFGICCLAVIYLTFESLESPSQTIIFWYAMS